MRFITNSLLLLPMGHSSDASTCARNVLLEDKMPKRKHEKNYVNEVQMQQSVGILT